MRADDPRHGSPAGRVAGCSEDCCLHASYVYEKRRRMHVARTGSGYSVPAWRVRRRLEALQALGWSMPVIAEMIGTNFRNLYHVARQEDVTRARFEQVAAVYDRLSMRLPPAETHLQRISVAKTKGHAARNGFAPPLAWDDIDDPDERPKVGVGRNPDDVDEAVVDRLLAGIRVPSTPAEKREALRRWIERGGSERALCERHGWKEGRYKDRTEEAA